MKFYVHYSEITQVFEWESNKAGTFTDVIMQFINSADIDNVKKELLIGLQNIQISNSKGKLIDRRSDVASTVRNREDVFLKLETCKTTESTEPAEKIKSSGKLKFYIHYEPKTGATSTHIVEWGKSDKGSLQELIKLFVSSAPERVRNELSSRLLDIQLTNSNGMVLESNNEVISTLKNRDDLYGKLLPSAKDTSTSSATTDEQIRLTKICDKAAKELKSGDTKRAVLLYETVLKVDPSHIPALEQLIDVFLMVRRPKVALKYAKILKKLKSSTVFHKMKLGECYLMLKNSSKAEEIFNDIVKDGIDSLSKEDQLDIQCALGQAYELQGKRDMALVMYQNVLQRNNVHLTAILRYADLTSTDADRLHMSVQIAMSAMVHSKDDPRVPVLLSELVQKPRGMEILEEVLGSAWNSSEGLFYIYNHLYQNGATDEARTILWRAHELDPNNLQILLTYMHVLELKGCHGECIQVTKKQLKNCHLAEQSHRPLLEVFLAIIESVPDDIYLWNSDFAVEIPTIPSSAEDSVIDSVDLYLIAVLFTAVKILYVNGALKIVEKLVQLLECLWTGKDLHKTDIRNEAAYFQCILQVMKQTPPESISCDNFDKENFIYFISDSHCITPAWQTLQYKDTSHTIHPVLSTGTKIWHLRDEEKMYPKEGFHTAIKKVPNNATVILNLGEIDCREALVTCVQKCYYDNLDEAIDSLIDIYVKVLNRLFEKHQWTIYVHPVAPVIDVTRAVVRQFNRALKVRIQNSASLKWLDFEDDLFKSDGSLKSNYVFDGTHLHPNYLKLLQDQL